MNVWRPVDAIAQWILDNFTPRNQLRLGVIMVLIGVAYFAYMPFADEQPAIYTMSAFALIFAGVATVCAVETLIEQKGPD